MPDLEWERSIEIQPTNYIELNRIFKRFDSTLTVLDYSIINLGCRNSNYKVVTNKGEYLLRISPVTEINNEKAACDLLYGVICMPKLLYCSSNNEVSIFIYEFIEGVPLQKLILENNRCETEVIKQAAKAAALIHNFKEDMLSGFAELKGIPPYELWCGYFLNNPFVKERLGNELLSKLNLCILKRSNMIPEIEGYTSLIHCDFRPANMLLDNNNRLFFVDWEYAGIGHSLADIGQFFRYRQYFNKTDMTIFENYYNEYSNIKLPVNWIELSLFRDLVNPLQMLSYKQEAPLKYGDLISIIKATVDYWN